MTALAHSPAVAYSLGALIFERLFYCVTAGTALVLLVSLVLRLFPTRNSHTRFAVWFATLMTVVALPFFAFVPQHFWSTGITPVPRALFTVPSSWAEYAVLAWAVLAALGVARLGFGLWQLRSLRRDAVELDSLDVSQEIRALMEHFAGRRAVRLLVSSRVQVPTAIGFFRPAIVLPAWLVQDDDGPSQPANSGPTGQPANENLKFVLLHELAHLRRWDDWTNLVQKLIKAIFFFHPGVFWIERNLALDREMACDDAVLAETGSPRNYAHCLATLAEKSFLRRQLALAQAAVSHMKQLSRRVAGILDNRRPHGTSIWKPAIPLVAGVAVLCAVSASPTTELIGFSDALPLHAVADKTASPLKNAAPADSATPAPPAVIPAGMKNSSAVQAIPADLRYTSRQPRRGIRPSQTSRYARPHSLMQRAAAPAQTQRSLTADQVRMVLSSYALTPVPLPENKAGAANVVLLVFTTRQVSNRDSSWQVSSWQLYLYVPPPTKQVPSKI